MDAIEKIDDRFQGVNHGEIRREDLLSIFLDVFDTVRYGNIVPAPAARPIDSTYLNNEAFWNDARSNRHFEGMRVALKKFHLTEWLPSAPGRYYTGGARESRRRARLHLNHGRGEYDTLGKYGMVLGGVGCIRLLSKEYGSDLIYFLCASSTGIAHQGIPLAVTEGAYREAIQSIKEYGGCVANIVGTIRALPILFATLEYDTEIPKYCIFVDSKSDLEIKRDSQSDELLATVAVTFSRPSQYRGEFQEEEKYRGIVTTKAWSFASFKPSFDEGSLREAVDWMKDYAIRHSGFDEPEILADFDEHHEYFGRNVEFPLGDLSRGLVDSSRLDSYARKFGVTIIKEVVMGDKFENIHHATIVNRSVVKDAFNNVDEETAAALETVADEIERAKNADATENFNSFAEELRKPEPKKAVLRTLWTGVTTALPSILQMTDVVTKISKLFTG
ncbi:MAG TPA: hypothetical protein VN256_00650 [Pyrinomonadaceae bacterium]|nr:hypothetical protein [Pyrinomonadaceae bacterium]